MNTKFFTTFRGSVDRQSGVIRGVSVVSMGEALGHAMRIDRTTLEQVKAAADRAESLQVKIDHWSGFEGIVGTLRGFTIEGDQLRADLHLLESHPARERVLEMAEKMPANFGLSIVFEGVPEELNGERFARCTELFSVDLVDRPAANPSGLFTTPSADLVELRRKHLSELDGYRSRIHAFELQVLEKDAEITELRRERERLTRRVELLMHSTEEIASRMAAQIVASTGTTAPAKMTPAGDQTRQSLTGIALAKAANQQRQP